MATLSLLFTILSFGSASRYAVLQKNGSAGKEMTQLEIVVILRQNFSAQVNLKEHA